MSDFAKVGDVIAGKYVVERVVGEGGMGIVIAARHLGLDEAVAIKLLHPRVANSAELVERFAREARAASKIKSEQVVRVTDVDTLPSGSPYMVMELLEGDDLDATLRERGAFPVQTAVAVVLRVSEALAEAHSIGIVHRDLKPSNLFLTRRRDGTMTVKILDFGISKVMSTDGIGQGVTSTRSLVGSPSYMSPEQMLTPRTVDARTDIWSLGVVLYELLAGRTPFCGDEIPQVCAQILHSLPPPLGPHVPPALEAVVRRCLEKDRERRFQNVAELAQSLWPFAPPTSRVDVDRVLALSGGIPRGASPPEERSVAAIPEVGQRETIGRGSLSPRTGTLESGEPDPSGGAARSFAATSITAARPLVPNRALALVVVVVVVGIAALVAGAMRRSGPTDGEVAPATQPPQAAAADPTATESAAPPPADSPKPDAPPIHVANSAAPPADSAKPAASASEKPSSRTPSLPAKGRGTGGAAPPGAAQSLPGSSSAPPAKPASTKDTIGF